MTRLFFVILILICRPVWADVDFTEIKKSALLSAASYASAEVIEKRLVAGGYDLRQQQTLADSGLSYFLASSSTGHQYLSFRGTSNLENALVDLDLALQLDADLNIQLHQGFAGAAKMAYQNVKAKLDKNKPISTTGHSLGGAIAVIVAMHLQRDGYQLEGVITFGQPKVTNVAGAEVFSALPLMRIVTPKDIVPLVPPLSPLQLKNLDIYWHMGSEIILLENKEYAQIKGIKSMMRATKFVSSVPDKTNLDAHQIATYLALIEQKLVAAQPVPYTLEINVFGFTLD